MLQQNLTPLLRPQTTAHLAQTMSLLELTSDELRQKVEADLASNPALELADVAHCPYCHRAKSSSGPCPVCSYRLHPSQTEPIIFVSPSSDFSFPKDYSTEHIREPDEWTAEIQDLPTFVFRQIALELDPNDRPIAAFILTSLDEDGLLRVPLHEIALYHHVPISKVEKVLRLVQRAEPIGVGSPTPQSALLVQLEALSETRPIPELASRAVEEGFNLLSRRAYDLLGRLLHVSHQEAEELAKFISDNLNPYPARAHWGDFNLRSAAPHVYQQADILISVLKDTSDSPFVVEIVSPYSGCLRVNPLFREAIQQAPEDKSQEWQEDIERANLLVKCIQQRNNTMVRLMQRLVVLQRHFILGGDAQLVPTTRAQLASELNLHESTISRAVSNKAVQLPNRRIIPMSKMFDRSLNVRTVMQEIIVNEDHPLSDAEIVERLNARGYFVARRTVAKYRSIEGILPGRLRYSKKRSPRTQARISENTAIDQQNQSLPRTQP